MPDFERLQRELDDLLKKLTKQDWDNWLHNSEKRSEEKKQEMLMQAYYTTAKQEAKFSFQHKLIEEASRSVTIESSDVKKINMPFGEDHVSEYEQLIRRNLLSSLISKKNVTFSSFLEPKILLVESQYY